jgi:hypothetical protein
MELAFDISKFIENFKGPMNGCMQQARPNQILEVFRISNNGQIISFDFYG